MLKAFIVFLAFISEGFTSQAELVQLERIGEQKKQAGVKLLTACHDLSETIQNMHNLEMKCAEANYAIEVTQITLHSFLLYKKTLSKLITELKGIKLEDENSQAYDYLVADNILSLFDDLRAQFKEQEDNLVKKK